MTLAAIQEFKTLYYITWTLTSFLQALCLEFHCVHIAICNFMGGVEWSGVEGEWEGGGGGGGGR